MQQLDPDNNIWVAASDGDIALVSQFIASGVSINAKDPNGYTPVAAAASYNHLDLLRLLLQGGADPNVVDNEGDTPLHVTETVAVAEILIAAGANPHARNEEGVLPIEVADEEERDELVAYLKNFTPDYRSAERHLLDGGSGAPQSETDALLHVLQAGEHVDEETGERTLNIDMARLQELVASGQLDEIIRIQREREERGEN
ncbi:ankyrin repeat-containing domain protein [Zopfochytrium polystomum]|nr:ankyrin repeat-containing domain protein [Zopfochytrium polystomum]